MICGYDGNSAAEARDREMTIEYIRYTVENSARGEELREAYSRAAKQLDEAVECLSYELSVC